MRSLFRGCGEVRSLLGCGDAIAFWRCGRAIAFWDVEGDRFLGCGRAIAFGDVEVRSLFGMWRGAIVFGVLRAIVFWDVRAIALGASQNGTKQKYLERMNYSDKRSVDGGF